MEIFQRMRQSNYDDIFLLLRHIKDANMGIQSGIGQLPPPGTTAGVERLPPIQAILDVPGRNMTPVNLTHSHSMSSEDSRTSSVPDLVGGMPAQQRSHHYDTLEPTFHPNHPSQQQHQQQPPHHHGMPPPMTYSSEESAGSIGSTSLEHVQPKQPYHTP
jgi:hypothetical protein